MEHLPLDVLGLVLTPLLGFAPALEAVCHSWLSLVSACRASGRRPWTWADALRPLSAPARVEGPAGRWRPATLGLFELAERGHSGLLVWTHASRGGFTLSVAFRVLAGAAKGGHEALARLAKGWGEAQPRNCWGPGYRKGPLAVGWSACDLDEVMFYSAAGGSEALVLLSREWGATSFRRALAGAARGGHEALARRARDWGASNFDEGLRCAAEGGHEALARLAKDWGESSAQPLDFNAALGGAAMHGHETLACLFKAWGATNFDRAIVLAAEGGHLALVLLIKEWGARAFNEVMISAAKGGHEGIVRLARRWGSIAYGAAAERAAAHGYGALACLLREWEQGPKASVLVLDPSVSDSSKLWCDACQRPVPESWAPRHLSSAKHAAAVERLGMAGLWTPGLFWLPQN
jgi:hypothetical protein